MNESNFATFTHFGPCPELQNEWTVKTLVLTREQLLNNPIFFHRWWQRTEWTSKAEAESEAEKYEENDRKIRKAVKQLIAEDGLGSWNNVIALTGQLYHGPYINWREKELKQKEQKEKQVNLLHFIKGLFGRMS